MKPEYYIVSEKNSVFPVEILRKSSNNWLVRSPYKLNDFYVKHLFSTLEEASTYAYKKQKERLYETSNI